MVSSVKKSSTTIVNVSETCVKPRSQKITLQSIYSRTNFDLLKWTTYF